MALLESLDHCMEGKGWIFNLQQRITNFSAFRETFSGYDVSGARILDIGCGTSGCVHFIWSEKKFSYFGIDLSFSYLRWGRRHFPAANQTNADAQYLPLKKTDFDFVCIFSLLHHLPDSVVQNLARELERVSPHTRILIADPLFPESCQNFSDKFSSWLLNHDRGNFIREADAYVKLFGNNFQMVTAFRFKCCMHYFCGFELRRK
jgi:ubiquinone/menaquinone biosynthesis C-methylase UbiE